MLLLVLLLAIQNFSAGETLDYDVTWIAIAGGSMRMTIAPQPGDPSHYRMTSMTESNSAFAKIYAVRDEIESVVDRKDFSTLHYNKHLVEGGKEKDDSTAIDEKTKLATRERPGKETEKVAVPKPVFDPLSLVYHLRELDLTPGKVHRFRVFADGKLYTLEATVTGREAIETPAGKFNTVIVEPRMAAGGLFRDENATLTIWYTDDARHIPVKISSDVKVGAITATLRGVRTGVTSIEP